MSFLVSQEGSKPEWLSDSTKTASYLIDLLGLDREKYFMKLFNQVDGLAIGKELILKDLSLIIIRY